MSVHKIINSATKLVRSRFKEVFMWLWITAVSCLIVSRGSPPLLPFIMTIISIFFISSSVYIYNDTIDFEFDKFNLIKKNRPLPIGQVSIKDAKKLVYTFGFLGLSIILLVNIYSFIFSSIYFILFMIYSYPKIYLKRLMIVKESIITSGVIFTSLIGSYAIINFFSLKAFFASVIFAIFMFTAQPAMQDTVDIEQDKRFGVKTLASIMSWKRKMQLFITGILIIMTLTPLTYTYLGFNALLPIFVVLGCLVLLRYIFPIMNTFEIITLQSSYRVAYIVYIIIQLSMIIGALDLHFIP